MKIEGDCITFSSGRTRYANCGIVGLSPDLSVSEGYDGGIWSVDELDLDFNWRDKEEHLTADDLQELANFMMSRWQEFGRKYGTGGREIEKQRENT